MPIALILGKLWENKKLIAEILCTIVAAFVIYHFVISVPKQLKAEKAKVIKHEKELERLNELNTLYTGIEQGRVLINASVQTRISSLRGSSMPRNAVIIRGGRVLPSLPHAGASN